MAAAAAAAAAVATTAVSPRSCGRIVVIYCIVKLRRIYNDSAVFHTRCCARRQWQRQCFLTVVRCQVGPNFSNHGNNPGAGSSSSSSSSSSMSSGHLTHDDGAVRCKNKKQKVNPL